MTPDEFRAALERLEMKPADAAAALGMAVPSVYRYLKGARRIPKPMELAIGNIEKLRALGERPAEKYVPMVAFAPVDEAPRMRMGGYSLRMDRTEPDADAGILRLIGKLQGEVEKRDNMIEERDAIIAQHENIMEQVESAIGVGDYEVAAGVLAQR